MGFFMTTLTKNTSQTFKINRNNLILSGIILLISIVSTWFFASVDHKFAAIWLLSNVAGFVLQRSRFCFASGFRDLFLFGSGANMKGIILGLVVSSIGFTAILHWITPNILTGDVATDAHVFPVGISTIVGGFLFSGSDFLNEATGGLLPGTTYGLQEAYQDRINTIENTLKDKYNMTDAEIADVRAGTYKGDVDTTLLKRLTDLDTPSACEANKAHLIDKLLSPSISKILLKGCIF